MTAQNKQPSIQAARVLHEMVLLGKKRDYGDPLSADEVARIPSLGLRAMVDSRDIELMGDLESTSPGREIAGLRRDLGELRARLARVESQLAATAAVKGG